MAELNVVVADGYDREVFARTLLQHRSLTSVKDRLSRVLPHAEPLLQDLFCALFKLNTVVRKAAELAPAVLINRQILESVLGSAGLDGLRARTELNESFAAQATRVLGERILETIKQTFREHPRELLNAVESARDDELLQWRREDLRQLQQSNESDEASTSSVAEDLEDEIGELETRLSKHRRQQSKAAKRLLETEDSMTSAVRRLPQQLDETERLARSFSPGGDSAVDAQRRLELGHRIMNSSKLKRLARLVGAFREVAFEARRRRVVEAPQETHSVSLGAELERLLPSELLGLRYQVERPASRALHLEFLRRLAEKQLLQYQLQAASSRGPMVVCLDGSGSMHGAKELWGKAVALTLMEIARRERRRCLAIIFSSGHPLFEIELLSKRGFGARATVLADEVVRFAEHFPGGGTDFEPPLERAVDAVSAGSYRRGDIVFITDGHAPVSPALIERVRRERKRHRFKIRAVLVDVGDHESREVERFADDVRRVTDLTSESLGDMFSMI